MNKNLTIILLCLFIATIISCRFNKKSTAIPLKPILDSNTNLLALYGQYIYVENNCQSCHTLDYYKKSSKVSLDGIGGKFNERGFYHRLKEPEFMRERSKMPAFPNLFVEELTRVEFDRIIDQEYETIKLNKDSLWNELTNQAKEYSVDLANYGVSISSKLKFFGILAYLQNIPSSKEKQKEDSLINLAQLRRISYWDSISTDTSNLASVLAFQKHQIDEGKLLFQENCKVCHGNNGAGFTGPNLTDEYWKNGDKKEDIFKIISEGKIEKGMMSWKNYLNPNEVSSLVAYIVSLKGTNPPNAKEPEGIKK